MPVRRWVAHGAFAVLASGFVALAIHRRLNFDEALALRSGWLELARLDAEPAFVMPWTLLLGGLAHAVADPGAVFLFARLATVLGILAALLYALARIGLGGTRRSAAGVFVLTQVSFLTHGLEFRYDAAILVALLVLLGAVAPAGSERPAIAGVAVALLALHHLKGLVFALVLGAWCVARLGRGGGALWRFAAAAGATVAVWLACLGVSGLTGRWLETLGGFWTLASAAKRVSPADALGPSMLRDLAWWIVASAGLVSALVARRRESAGPAEGATILFAAVTLGFVLVHPHPWAYMLALPAPFLAAVAVGRWPGLGSHSRLGHGWLAAAAVALALQLGLGRGSPVSAWQAAFAAPRAPIVEALRSMQAAAAPGDRVLDPSGLAYFLPPCTHQWYLDTLFAEGVARGVWMAELARGVPRECKWALATYRLGAIPGAARSALARDFVRFPSGVAVRASEIAERERAELESIPAGRIESFW